MNIAQLGISSNSDLFKIIIKSENSRPKHNFLYNIFHWKENREFKRQTFKAVSEYLQERYKIDNNCFDKVWKQIGNKIWANKSNMKLSEKLLQIDKMFSSRLIYHGKGVSAPKQISADVAKTNASVQKVVRALLHGGPVEKSLFEKKLLKAVLISTDIEWLTSFKNELQHELDHLKSNLPKNKKEELLWRGFLGNVLAFLPFTYPKEGDEITIPFLKDGKCQDVKYKINVLDLTSTLLFSSIKALGLTPQDNEEAPSILDIIGTTYPAGPGAAATFFSDFTPGYSVGEVAFKQGKAKIAEWMKDKSGVHLTGTSLGGALAFHTLREFHDKLGRVDVYNPPGLYTDRWKGVKFDEGCDINIFCQSGDLVSNLGKWPEGEKVHLYKLIAHQPGVKEGVISSHARAFTGCDNVTILKEDPTEVNKSWKRKILTFLHRFIAPCLVFIPCSLILGAYLTAKVTKNAFKFIFMPKKKAV